MSLTLNALKKLERKGLFPVANSSPAEPHAQANSGLSRSDVSPESLAETVAETESASVQPAFTPFSPPDFSDCLSTPIVEATEESPVTIELTSEEEQPSLRSTQPDETEQVIDGQPARQPQPTHEALADLDIDPDSTVDDDTIELTNLQVEEVKFEEDSSLEDLPTEGVLLSETTVANALSADTVPKFESDTSNFEPPSELLGDPQTEQDFDPVIPIIDDVSADQLDIDDHRESNEQLADTFVLESDPVEETPACHDIPVQAVPEPELAEITPLDEQAEAHAEAEAETEPPAVTSDDGDLGEHTNTESSAASDVTDDTIGQPREQIADSVEESSTCYPALVTPTSYERSLAGRLEQSTYREAISRLRDEIEFRNELRWPVSLMFAAQAQTARTSDLTSSIGLLLSETNAEVLLVDANLEEQTLTRRFDAVNHKGLCDALDPEQPLTIGIRPTSTRSMHFLPCGDDVRGLSRVPDLLDHERLEELIEFWLSRYHYVIVDAGPADGNLVGPLGERLEATVLVVSLETPHKHLAKAASETLVRSCRRVLGCVVTDAPTTAATA